MITDAEFQSWLAGDHPRQTLAVLTAWDPDSQSEVALRLGDRRYVDGNVVYASRLIEPLAIRRVLSAFGASGEASIGEVTIDNSDRKLDAWFDYSFDGRAQKLLFGDPSWPISDFRPLFDGLGDEGIDVVIEPSGQSTITVYLKDLYEELDRPIVERPLSMHESALLEPYPLCLGRPLNVKPKLTTDDRPPDQSLTIYAVNAWDVDIEAGDLPFSEIYENGAPSSKSVDDNNRIGGGDGKFRFNVNEPEGTVTCDPYAAADDPVSGTGMHKWGEIIKYVVSHTMMVESGIARGGTDSTIVFDENASDEDDFYNAPTPPTAGDDPGYIAIFKRDGSAAHGSYVTDYVGGSYTATLNDTAPFTIDEGDRYDVVLSSPKRYGALDPAKVDTASCDQLDIDAPHPIGYYDESGRTSYVELLDDFLPLSWHCMTRESKLAVGVLKAPTGNPKLTIRGNDTHSSVRLTREETPIYRARVGYAKNWNVMNGPDASVGPDRAEFLGREYLYEPAQDLSILKRHPTAKPRDFDSYLLQQSHAKVHAERIMDLIGVPRAWGEFTTLAAPMQIDLHDEFRAYDDGHEKLATGYDFRVMSLIEYPLSGRVEMEGWG